MCVVSMVMDHYNDRFNPWFDQPQQPYRGWPGIPGPPVNPTPFDQEDFNKQLQRIVDQNKPPKPSPEVEALRELIKEFREALKAAKLVDVLTDQPDCEDTV